MSECVASADVLFDKCKMAKGKSRRGWKNRGQSRSVSASTFVSEIEGLVNHTFDCGHASNAAQFEKTKEEFGLWCQRKFDYGGNDVCRSINDMQTLHIVVPDLKDPGELKKLEAMGVIEGKLWYRAFAIVAKQKEDMDSAARKAYGVCLKLCSPKLTTRLEGTTGFGDVKTNEDVVGLLRLIRSICCKFGDTCQPVWALVQAKKSVYLFLQQTGMYIDEYLKQFKALIATVESHGGSFGDEPGLILLELEGANVGATGGKTLWDSATPHEMKAAKALSRAKIIATMFLSGASFKQHQEMKDDLANEWTLGSDRYPTTIEETVRLLNNYKITTRPQAFERRIVEEDEEMAFVERGEEEDASFGKLSQAEKKKRRECNTCGVKGHYSYECPTKDKNKDKDKSKGNEAERGISQLNFDDFEDDESCEDGDDMLNVAVAWDDESGTGGDDDDTSVVTLLVSLGTGNDLIQTWESLVEDDDVQVQVMPDEDAASNELRRLHDTSTFAPNNANVPGQFLAIEAPHLCAALLA